MTKVLWDLCLCLDLLSLHFALSIARPVMRSVIGGI
jgi:hypothetical protein